ncbi:S41 family peptidase [Patescibacteria group bacterium]|nr:S41 family peptidase [Patescibacteria group bacterium]
MIKNKKFILYISLVFFFSFTVGFLIGIDVSPNKIISKSNFLPVPKNIDPDINYDLFRQLWMAVKDDYVDQPVTDKDLFYGSLEGLVQGLDDPYSIFLNPDLAKKFMDDMSGSFEGIGIEIGMRDDRLTVIAPLTGTPAFRAGLLAGDKIYAIDTKSTFGMGLDEAVHLIRGIKGTPVILTVLHKNKNFTEDVEIIRDVIEITSVSWEMKEFPDSNKKIAYIKVSHFSEDTWQAFIDICSVVLRASPDALLLDLRNNPGGYLDTAVDMAGYWVDNDVITFSTDANKYKKEYKSNGPGDFKDIPTVILVNQGSASASEILAGALQDYNQATIIGEQTFGKGSVQELHSFSDGSALKLTVAYWYTPLGRSINENGISPDIDIKITVEDLENKIDLQMDTAIEILKESI